MFFLERFFSYLLSTGYRIASGNNISASKTLGHHVFVTRYIKFEKCVCCARLAYNLPKENRRQLIEKIECCLKEDRT
jgi:hypothetical protein